MNEILDYGIELLPKAFENSPKDIKALCVIGVQLRQTLAHLDAAAVLASVGNCFSASLQCRSLVEISFTLEWLLKADTETRVNYLYVANLRRRRQWQSIAIPGTPEASRNADAAKRISISPGVLNEIRSEIEAIDEVLKEKRLSLINSKFQQKYQTRHYDEPWYKVYGTSSIRKIAEEIGKEKDYKHSYSTYSEIAHGESIWKNVNLGRDNPINPIRSAEMIPKLANMAISSTFQVYWMVLNQYIMDDIPGFKKTYKHKWKTRYLLTLPKRGKS